MAQMQLLETSTTVIKNKTNGAIALLVKMLVHEFDDPISSIFGLSNANLDTVKTG